MGSAFLEVRGLKKFFPIKKGLFQRTVGYIRAVDDVSFTIEKGKTLGLVGESGCGKTTIGRVILSLYEPTAGAVFLEGVNIFKLRGSALQKVRKRLQVVFQDPYSSLNPRFSVENIISEGMVIHRMVRNAQERREKSAELLRKVRLPEDYLTRYPHEFSGGERQRIGIARALAVEPEFLVLDEPVSALDVSIQAQILNLLKALQEEFGLTYLFIAHNLSVVKYMSERIAVMYLGKIVELSDAETLYTDPLHPYTQSLISAIPALERGKQFKKRIILTGDVPSPASPPSGCYFHPRCFRKKGSICAKEPPPRVKINTREVACHLYS
jgi:oligopeptide transport system ATP-binding protein